MNTDKKLVDNGKCMLIKLSEYNELIDKLNTLPKEYDKKYDALINEIVELKKAVKADNIDIRIIFANRNSSYRRTYYDLDGFDINGSIVLSNKITLQIISILKTVQIQTRKLHEKELLQLSEDISRSYVREWNDKLDKIEYYLCENVKMNNRWFINKKINKIKEIIKGYRK